MFVHLRDCIAAVTPAGKTNRSVPEFPCHHLPFYLPHLQIFTQVSEDVVQLVPSLATSDIPHLAAIASH